MAEGVLINLSKDDILRPQQQRRVKETWDFQRGYGFYTIRNALCKVQLMKGRRTGQKVITIQKGKQFLSLVPQDAVYLKKAIDAVLEGGEKNK